MLTTEIQGLPIPVMQFMSVDTVYRPPLEWTDGMADMNWIATGKEVRWVLARRADQRRKHEDCLALPTALDDQGAGLQRSPVLPSDESPAAPSRAAIPGDRAGRSPNPYLVWKDTTIIPVGSTVDLLVDLSNPGTWMLHCHIAEHMESGMMAAMTVSAPN